MVVVVAGVVVLGVVSFNVVDCFPGVDVVLVEVVKVVNDVEVRGVDVSGRRGEEVEVILTHSYPFHISFTEQTMQLSPCVPSGQEQLYPFHFLGNSQGIQFAP